MKCKTCIYHKDNYCTYFDDDMNNNPLICTAYINKKDNMITKKQIEKIIDYATNEKRMEVKEMLELEKELNIKIKELKSKIVIK